jgi:hypothetical protein
MDENVGNRKDAAASGNVAPSQQAKEKQAPVWRRIGASWYHADPDEEDPQKHGNHSLEYRLAGHTPDRAHEVFDQVDRNGRTIRGRSVTFAGGSKDKPAPQAIGDTEFVRSNASARRRQDR